MERERTLKPEDQSSFDRSLKILRREFYNKWLLSTTYKNLFQINKEAQTIQYIVSKYNKLENVTNSINKQGNKSKNSPFIY